MDTGSLNAVLLATLRPCLSRLDCRSPSSQSPNSRQFWLRISASRPPHLLPSVFWDSFPELSSHLSPWRLPFVLRSFMECWGGRCWEGVPQDGFILVPTTQRTQVSFPQCPDLRFCRPPSRVGRNSSTLEVQLLDAWQAQLCFSSHSPPLPPSLQAAGGGSASPASPGGGDAAPGTPEGDAGHGGWFQQCSSPAPGPAGCPGNRVSEALAPGWEGLVDVPFC